MWLWIILSLHSIWQTFVSVIAKLFKSSRTNIIVRQIISRLAFIDSLANVKIRFIEWASNFISPRAYWMFLLPSFVVLLQSTSLYLSIDTKSGGLSSSIILKLKSWGHSISSRLYGISFLKFSPLAFTHRIPWFGERGR